MTRGLNLHTITAYGDESGSDHRKDPNAYVFAVAYISDEQQDQVRDDMLGLLLPGQSKLHWRDESPDRHRAITKRVAGAGIEHMVVVRTGPASERPERRRKQVLKQIFLELQFGGIERAVFESRGKADDKRDRDLLDGLRANKSLTSPLRLDHKVGRREPLLWLADAACGAVTAARTGTPEYLNELKAVTTVIDITSGP